ncbi:UNVERIFIED_ORG: hypothetical protein ABIB21_002368 [Arthrobacter sp. UYEF13]
MALLSSRASSLQGQIQSAPWKGADDELFRQDWSGNHRPSWSGRQRLRPTARS